MVWDNPNFGSLGAKAFFLNPPLPNIIAEWAALVPLICHLASYAADHELIGQISLTCDLSVGLFPKLGSLAAISRLVSSDAEFLDQASTKGNMFNVWDVLWGGSFPSANCSASRIITTYATQNSPRTKVPDLPEQKNCSNGMNDKTQEFECTVTQRKLPVSDFRRPQTLHVIRFGRQVRKRSTRRKIRDLLSAPVVQAWARFVELGLVVVLILSGSYGTAVVLLNSLLCRFACRFVTIERPGGYLKSNETQDATMLEGLHKNITIWYLHVGDRGVVDWLLNKTMIRIKQPHPVLRYFFWVAHQFQLFAMIYVAAQKGWDGVCLLGLLAIDRLIRIMSSKNQLAQTWLEINGVSVDAQCFEFSGRTPMLGAIHLITGARKSDWMDDILAPSARRDVWNNRLHAYLMGVPFKESDQRSNLTDSDHRWVELNTSLSIQAAEVMQSIAKSQTIPS